MSPDAQPVRIVVEFAGPDSAVGQVVLQGPVTVGQLALAAWLLERQAEAAHQGAMVQAARDQLAVRSLAAGLRNGGR
jgi:hypothetical protein